MAISNRLDLLDIPAPGRITIKHVESVAESHVTGVDVDGSMMENVVGTCAEVTAQLGTVDVRCLVDTGAQVSTITEDCFQKYFVTELL